MFTEPSFAESSFAESSFAEANFANLRKTQKKRLYIGVRYV